MIYLDNAATTECLQSALDVLVKYNSEEFFNPSALYHDGVKLKTMLDEARAWFAEKVGYSNNGKTVFTGSATEANNQILTSFIRRKDRQALISIGEHPSVYNTAKQLLSQGYDVKFIPLQSSGEIDYDALECMLKNKKTSLISAMLVSNETGAINDMAKISALRDKYCPDCVLHSDCVQAFGKIKFNAKFLGIDIVTLSAHKIHGPKGVGAICYNKRCNLTPLIFGGEQENNLRAGTENVPSILAFKISAETALASLADNYNHASQLKRIFMEKIETNLKIKCNTSKNSSPYILSLTLDGVRGETILNALQQKGIIIGTGSACSSKKVGNRILEAMGVKDVINSIRISFSSSTKAEDVSLAADYLKETYHDLFVKLH